MFVLFYFVSLTLIQLKADTRYSKTFKKVISKNCRIKMFILGSLRIVSKISSTHYTAMVNKIKDTSPPFDSQPFFLPFSQPSPVTHEIHASFTVLVHSIFREIPLVFLRCPLSLATSIHSSLFLSLSLANPPLLEFDLACVRSLDDRLSDSFLLGVRTIG